MTSSPRKNWTRSGRAYDDELPTVRQSPCPGRPKSRFWRSSPPRRRTCCAIHRARLYFWQAILAVALTAARDRSVEAANCAGAPTVSLLRRGCHKPWRFHVTALQCWRLEPLLVLLAAGAALRILWVAVGLLRLARIRKQARPLQQPPGCFRRLRPLVRVGSGERSGDLRLAAADHSASDKGLRTARQRPGSHREPRAVPRPSPRLAVRHGRGADPEPAVVPPGGLVRAVAHPTCTGAGGGSRSGPCHARPRRLSGRAGGGRRAEAAAGRRAGAVIS